jgi:hypothetical protein
MIHKIKIQLNTKWCEQDKMDNKDNGRKFTLDNEGLYNICLVEIAEKYSLEEIYQYLFRGSKKLIPINNSNISFLLTTWSPATHKVLLVKH